MSATSTTAPSPRSGTPTTEEDKGPALVLRISLPSQERITAIKAFSRETLWAIKHRIMGKMASGIEDAINYGLYLPTAGRFLDEKSPLGSYVTENSVLLEFIPKYRVLTTATSGEPDLSGGSPSLNSKKKQKKFAEDVVKGHVDKVRERGMKGIDPNFYTESGDTPLVVAVLNNDRDMVATLIEQGALLDYRLGKKDGWKTPLHVAALHNKLLPLQLMLSAGAWVDCPDGNNLPALFYATQNSHPEAVLRLLLARATTETTDESGRAPLHVACYNNHEAIASLLIDAGCSMNAVNAVGNTPLHVAATRNAKECAKWLVLRGCDRERTNLSGQTAAQLATLSGNVEIADMIKKFNDGMVVPPPPPLPNGGPVEDLAAFRNPAPHSRAASTDPSAAVGPDMRRVSILAPGTEHPQITRSFSVQSVSSMTAKREPSTTSASPSRKRTAARGGAVGGGNGKARKSVTSEKFVPPPPSTPKPVGLVARTGSVASIPPSSLPGAVSQPLPASEGKAAPTVAAVVAATVSPVVRTAVPHVVAAQQPGQPSQQQHQPSPKPILAGILPPPPSIQPPAHLTAARPSIPSPLQFVAPPPPRAAPPPSTATKKGGAGAASTLLSPIPGSAPGTPSQANGTGNTLLSTHHARLPPPISVATGKSNSYNHHRTADNENAPLSPSDGPYLPRSPTKAQTHHILSMLRGALHGEEDLEVDLEVLLDGFGAMEKALDESEERCRELEKLVSELNQERFRSVSSG
ncbi:hypothetical protein HKX48_008016 [Thoreauomyces humboldtii]|nr:hypothetical protein HKX48_008016 [Thoreauomyces humboldtii]